MSILFHYKILVTLSLFSLSLNRCHTQPADSVKRNSQAFPNNKVLTSAPSIVPLKNMFGVNTYEWNFLQDPANPNLKSTIYETNMSLIKSFSGIRHYLNWGRMESTKGNYTFSPAHDGSWDYDLIYARCKQDGIFVLADIKTCPPWIVDTYPKDMQDKENAPLPYGLNKSDPASYTNQARMAFQFAARYGSNKNIDRNLVKADASTRWPNDPPNQIKIGLDLVKYVECDNERDKWWKGPATEQTAEEYAANMSAFYDGNLGKLGKDVGVKQADPAMLVVMGGLATCDINFVKKMIEWCKTNRGYRADGSINLCFDVINYHYYSNNGNILTHAKSTTGVAPELSMAGEIADEFVKLAKSLSKPVPVWVTEAGYDINQGSYQKASYIGNKTPLETQGDWILRTSLLYMRHGIQRLFFYQLLDDTPNADVQYATSGLAENGKRRPAADYILQANKLLGNYKYAGTINTDPLVDKYVSGSKTMYILAVPDQKGRTANYVLNVAAAKANIYTLTPGANDAAKQTVDTNNGKLSVNVSETPVIVEPVN
ncbi:hypothetical protein [Mucilaginibacter celer]|uniref:Glycoside hydrolase family 42 N-terminal domain-containing protein n=1 Tax=Mucilaginibacter celer TaxID=2305508 RepID=A0A494VL89_9SPHI|nr:hypothetical protein [Mucilaginibacter celer]AYL95977.1 hypothetical protein HYN43_012065 [Mucilaginibacter celer]